ncbi:hypothetical protein [Pleionea sediminis]|uniref:hypothetical protein n=1 Tax=Pleionea sediminis TaxID=2569479 RepID=UPI0011848761|nr:hypothetical protein [Pleionea sediminis]
MFLVIIALIVVTAWFYTFKSKNGNRHSVEIKKNELVRLCRGNERQAMRLLDYELNRKPSISQEAAIDNAIYRLKRD